MVKLFLSKLSNGDKIKVIYATYFLLKDFNEIEIKNIRKGCPRRKSLINS